MKKNTTRSSGIFELWFLDCPLLLRFAFRCIRQMLPHIWTYLSGLEVVCFLKSLLPDHENPSGGLSFNNMNPVKPVHASDNSLSPSLFQKPSICYSNNVSCDVEVVLATSMYFNGIGNDLLSARRV